ncbi:MAG: DUF1573 domain-containing protein [Planctomycetaceae bacterium]|nr:DUF1573 domain-containing protein [Planctomycetaceae bacterium]
MKKYAIQFIVFGAFLFSAFFACRVVVGFGVKVSYSIWKPRIVCNEATHNFGTIANSNPSHEFVVQNKGSRDLLVRNVVAGCGSCVEVESFTAAAIVPNGEVEIVDRLAFGQSC